jgi:hypothetical protein
MLSDRILSTLRFFDLQGIPLTMFEVHKYLLADVEQLRPVLNGTFELHDSEFSGPFVSLGSVTSELERLVESGQLSTRQGYYCLPAHDAIIRARLRNYEFGILRERRIRRFGKLLRFVPFVRAAAVGGSQALGQQTASSDIDMFIITDPEFLWLGRTLVTAYFQVFGVRRHDKKIANRFCLNHYLAGAQEVTAERDPYNALEYLRLRAIAGPEEIHKFQKLNLGWIKKFYPNTELFNAVALPRPIMQQAGEWLLRNRFGRWLERKLGARQMPRIKGGEHAVATDRELSFHSKERKYKLLREFYKL